MKSQEYQKRLAWYRDNLKKNPKYLETLDKCLNETGMELNVLDEVFLYIYAPVMVSFVEWVLNDAISRCKTRLYFLARDGYMMYEIAQIIKAKRNIKIDLRYLYISRYAIRMAEYSFVGKRCLDTLCVGGIDISFRKIMKRGGLDEAEVEEVARLAGYTTRIDEPLNYQQIQTLKEQLKTLPILYEYINRHSIKAYYNTTEYLKQEGLLDGNAYCLVDSGWIGTLQMSLQQVISHETGNNIKLEGYYFGMYERPRDADKAQYRPYYFDEENIKRKIFFSNCLFETIFSAPEGMTLGYRYDEEQRRYVPDTSKQKNANATQISGFLELLKNYVKHFCEISKTSEQNQQTIKMVYGLLKKMMGNPILEEAKNFGNLQFCDDVLELQLQPVAAKWNEQELKEQRFINKFLIKMDVRKGILHESAWAEGSIVNLKGAGAKELKSERMYKRFMYIRKAIQRQRK